MSEHQFKPGEHALLEVVVDSIDGEKLEVSPVHADLDIRKGMTLAWNHYEEVICTTDARHLLPVPRKGERGLALAELLERAKTHHLQAGMEVTLTIAEMERLLNDFLDVASKEPKFDSRDFLLEALSNLNEARKGAKS